VLDGIRNTVPFRIDLGDRWWELLASIVAASF
jgi:hypothetical protein